MKKKGLILLLLLLISFVSTFNVYSFSERDIKEMYKIKDSLISDYRRWIKGVDDIDQVLADHQKDYEASYYNGEYKIIIGKGKGKSLTGTLKASYCTSSKEIKKKSFFAELFS